MPSSVIDSSTGSGSGSASAIVGFIVSCIKTVGYFGVGSVLMAIGLLYTKQESLLYFPEIQGMERRTARNPRGFRSPSEYDIPFESLMIQCEDGVNIHSWLLLHRNSKTEHLPTIMFFHGNAGNIGLRLPNAQQMFNLLNANILMVEYRGYGESDSVKPTEAGLKLDAEAALNFIRSHQEIDPDRIFCFGRSLGGAVAFHLAQYAEQKSTADDTTSRRLGGGGSSPLLAGIIVENTFLSISKMVDQLMPFVAPLKFLILRIGWNSEVIAPRISLPILYLAGDKDELVPHNHMKELFELSGKASNYSKMHIIRNGTHNDSYMKGGKAYYEQIRAFTSQVISNRNINKSNSRSPSIEGTSSCTGVDSSVAVSMGEEESIEMGPIPIMPTSFVGMAKEASSRTTSEGDKKLK